MKIATLGIVRRRRTVLLGKKTGRPEIGEGKLNGPGGKKERGESVRRCMIRELFEEVGIWVSSRDMRLVAVIVFYAGGIPDFKVYVFDIRRWRGTPRRTESMTPFWFSLSHIPYRRMHDGDASWFPRTLAGKKLVAKVFYRKRAADFQGIRIEPFHAAA